MVYFQWCLHTQRMPSQQRLLGHAGPQIKLVLFSSVQILSLSHLHLNAPNSRSSSPPGRLSIYSNPESPSRQLSATPLTQAPNKQTSMAHYFLPHDMRPSFSSVMSGFLTSWMKEPELYTPWSARPTSASKGSPARCLSVNVCLNSSNIQSFSLAMRRITPQSVEETHATHVHSVSTPSSGSGTSVEATRLKLVTCDITPNEQRVTEAETIPSSEIPGSWEGLDAYLGEDEEQVPTISKHKVASIIQPSGSLAAKATTTQPLDTEYATIYSNEESGLYFNPDYCEEWEGDYSTGPRLILTRLNAMEEYEHLLAVENNNIPSQWFEDLTVPLNPGYAWSGGSSDSGSDTDSLPPQTPTQSFFDTYHTFPSAPEANDECTDPDPVSVLVTSKSTVKPVVEFQFTGIRWSEYPDDDDGLPELPDWT